MSVSNSVIPAKAGIHAAVVPRESGGFGEGTCSRPGLRFRFPV